MFSVSNSETRVNKKIQTLVHKTVWKEELLKFQLQEEKRSFADLKIKCIDGYFLAHKIVFAMSSEIEWEEKNSRFMAVWIVNHTLEETAKIMLLAYTGEILLVNNNNNWTFLDGLVKIFQLSEDKLNWGVPYNEHNELFLTLAQKRVRATKCCSLTNTEEEILIYGNGDIKSVTELETENTESIPCFQLTGYPCLHCPCIFIDETDFSQHEGGCRPVVVKTECQSPTANEIISTTSPEIVPTQSASQKRITVSPEETRCLLCRHETNSVMQLVDHFQTVHKVVPGKDYCMNPIKCNGCLYSKNGSNMSTFLYHVANCKKGAWTNLNEILDAIVDGKSFEETSPNIRKPNLSTRKKRKRVEDTKLGRNPTTKTTKLNDTLPLAKNGKKLNTQPNKNSGTPKNCTTKLIAPAPLPNISPSKAVELQEEIHEIKETSEPNPSANTPGEIMDTTLPLINTCENKTPKFIIPKRVKPGRETLQNKSNENSKRQVGKYHGPLKTPENPEKKVAKADTQDVRKRLVFKDNCNLMPTVTTEELTPEKDMSLTDIHERLMILASTPTSLTTGTKDAIVAPLPIEIVSRTTAPKRKKRKTSSINSLSSQQVVKEQNLSFTKPAIMKPANTNIKTQQPSKSSQYKWRCGYCRSKFKSQVFYMRHCCKTVAFPMNQPTFGQQPKATYIVNTKRGFPIPGKKKIVSKRRH